MFLRSLLHVTTPYPPHHIILIHSALTQILRICSERAGDRASPRGEGREEGGWGDCEGGAVVGEGGEATKLNTECYKEIPVPPHTHTHTTHHPQSTATYTTLNTSPRAHAQRATANLTHVQGVLHTQTHVHTHTDGQTHTHAHFSADKMKHAHVVAENMSRACVHAHDTSDVEVRRSSPVESQVLSARIIVCMNCCVHQSLSASTGDEEGRRSLPVGSQVLSVRIIVCIIVVCINHCVHELGMKR